MICRRTLPRLYQVGVHTPPGARLTGARMKHWPEQQIPDGFSFTKEQRFRLKAMPRDTGRIPRNYVLALLFRQQPAPLSSLWEVACADPATVLDSRRHLREVLKQARDEGFVYFDKDAETGEWQCLLTRERLSEVREMLQNNDLPETTGLRGAALQQTTEYCQRYLTMSREERLEHIKKLREEVAETSQRVRQYSRTEIDYLPYTDLNSKVNFMWWYEAKDGAATAKRVPAPSGGGALPVST